MTTEEKLERALAALREIAEGDVLSLDRAEEVAADAIAEIEGEA